MGKFGTHTILAQGAAAVGPTYLDPFVVDGSAIVLEVVMSAGGTGTLTITAEVLTSALPGGVPFYGHIVAGNAAAAWTTTVTNVAGTYRLGLPGLQVASGDTVRLAYALTAAVGNITVLAETFDGDASGVVGMMSPALELGEATHDDPVIATGIHPMLEAKTFDGAVLPVVVSAEGDAVRPAGSTRGVGYTMTVSQDGATSPVAEDDVALAVAGRTGMLAVGGRARGVQAAAVAQDDAAVIVTNLYREQVGADYDWASQASRTEEQDPLDTRPITDLWVSVTNLADNAVHYAYLQSSMFQHGSFQTLITAAGDTINMLIYGSNEAGVAPAAITDWTEISLDLWGITPLTNAAGAVNRIDVFDTAVQYEWYRISWQRVAGAASTADITVRAHRWY